MWYFPLPAGVASLALCCALATSCGPKPTAEDLITTRDLTLPGGTVIKAEVMITTGDLRKGMMYRTSLAPDHGMLFVHPTPGNYPYWMYQVLVPLDIIWLDTEHRVVLMIENAQPCKTAPDQCPQYVCPKPAHYVLEVPAGTAKKYNLQSGKVIAW